MHVSDTLLKVVVPTSCRVSQLSAYNKGVLVVPVCLTHTSPPPSHTHLHPPFSWVKASSKTDAIVGAGSGYRIGETNNGPIRLPLCIIMPLMPSYIQYRR